MGQETHHTPGPWKRTGYEVHKPGRGTIAKIPVAGPDRPGVVEARENAQLIAVAPELLEVAEEALERLEAYGPFDMRSPPNNPALKTASKLRDVLAKAKGES